MEFPAGFSSSSFGYQVVDKVWGSWGQEWLRGRSQPLYTHDLPNQAYPLTSLPRGRMIQRVLGEFEHFSVLRKSVETHMQEINSSGRHQSCESSKLAVLGAWSHIHNERKPALTSLDLTPPQRPYLTRHSARKTLFKSRKNNL